MAAKAVVLALVIAYFYEAYFEVDGNCYNTLQLTNYVTL